MKLRVRYLRKTKVLDIAADAGFTFTQLKSSIKENVFHDLGINADANFVVTLDGKTSAGEDGALVQAAGIVSGDLIKLLIIEGSESSPPVINPTTANESPQTSSAACEPGQSSASHTVSEMSVLSEISNSGQSATSSNDVLDIPCTSPGPIFFQDCANSSEVPHLLQRLYENDSVKTEFQALCIALHFIMSESGFFIEGHNDDNDILALLDSRMFVVEYSHSAGPNLKFNLTCNQLGSFILVNGVIQPCINTNEQVLTLQISTNDFVQSFKQHQKNSNAASVYKSLSKLARSVKDGIAYPALNNMREELRLPPVHGLLSLFPELLLRICSNLDFISLVRLSQVNKTLQSIATDDSLWRSLYIRDFKGHPTNVDSSWKTMYCKKFVREQEKRREMERRYREFQTEPWPQFPTPGFGTGAVPFPDQPYGMIGGEHDLNPAFPYGPFANQPRNPRRFPPTHPVHPMNPDNPLPGSRFDPIYPGGGFHPGRGGGLMDPDLEGFGGAPSHFGRNGGGGRHRSRFGFL